MSYFKPTTKPAPARYDLLARHEEAETIQARRDIVREPFVTHGRDATWVGDHIAAVVENPAPLWWYIAVSIAGGLAGLTGIGILYLICTGVGVWGENKSANWAWDITNFVFWIGIGHAGTMIAAVLYLTRQKWASGINRAAEAMTIFAVMCAGVFPAVHVGRVWFAWYMAPIPNGNAIWPNFRSPLLWDVFAVNTYLAVSIMFWYVGLIPDAATMRDRIKNKILKYVYAVICLGWRGSARQWANYEFCYLMLAGIATLLVITTCTVVSSDFSTSVIPGWHGTIFIPYFGVGAIYGGFCMLIILLVPIRQLYKLDDLVTLRHIDMCCRFVLLMALLITYIYGMEFFIAYYGGSPNEVIPLLPEPHVRPLLAHLAVDDVLQLRRPPAFLEPENPPLAHRSDDHRHLPQHRHVARALHHHRLLGHARLPALVVGHVLSHLDRRHDLHWHVRDFLPDVPPLHPLPARHRHLRSEGRPARGQPARSAHGRGRKERSVP